MSAAQGEHQRAVRHEIVVHQQDPGRRQALHVGFVGAIEKIHEQSANGGDRVPGGIVDQRRFFTQFEAQGFERAAQLGDPMATSHAGHVREKSNFARDRFERAALGGGAFRFHELGAEIAYGA